MRRPVSARSSICKKQHPRVLYVMLGETDEWAHGRRYDLYLDAAQRNDRFIKRLWETAQSMPEYANRTALVWQPIMGEAKDATGPATARKFPQPSGSGWRSWAPACRPRPAIERDRHAIADRRDHRRPAGRGLQERTAQGGPAPGLRAVTERGTGLGTRDPDLEPRSQLGIRMLRCAHERTTEPSPNGRSSRILQNRRCRHRGRRVRPRAAGTGRRARLDREGQTGPHRVLLLADPVHLQEPARWRTRRDATGTACCACGRPAVRAGAADEPGQRGRELAGDEAEVRRDHDAGLPAVHEGHVPRRHAHGYLLGAVRRRDRRQHVRRASVRSVDAPPAKKWLDQLVAKMVVDRHEGASTSRTTRRRTWPSTDDALRKAGVEVGKKWLDGVPSSARSRCG